jgi:hypothetical protein
MDNGANRTSPCEGYVVEIDGQFNSEYGSITAALSAGLALKHRNGGHAVRVSDAHERLSEAEEASEFFWWMTLDERAGWAARHVPNVS